MRAQLKPSLRTALAVLLALLGTGAFRPACAAPFALAIEVVGTDLDGLVVGVAAGATDLADPGIDALAPPGPGGAASVRLISPGDQQRLAHDFRGSLDGARFYLEVVPSGDTATPGPSIDLSWDSATLPPGRNWHLWRLTGHPFAPNPGRVVAGSAVDMAVGQFNNGIPIPPDAGQTPVYFAFGTPSAPTIAAVSPATGGTAGDTLVTVTGTGFMAGATVRFGGSAGTSPLVLDARRITVRTPSAGYTGAAVPVQVVNPDGGTATATDAFLFNDPPTAHAGGPYSIGFCAGLVLDAGASLDPNQERATLSYAWDLDNDGVFETTVTHTSAQETEPWRLVCTHAEFGNPAAGVHTVQVRVTDSGGRTATASATVLRTNLAPTAHAGGPYVIDEGGSLALDASGSVDPDLCSPIVLYEWDLDGDGVFGEFRATTPTPPALNWATLVALGLDRVANPLDGQPAQPLGVRVTDGTGATAQDTSATLTVYRNRPMPDFTVDGAGAPFAAVAIFADVRFEATAAHGRPGVAIARYDWDFDYNGARFVVHASGPSVVTRFPAWRTHQVAVRATDENGRSALRVHTLSVSLGGGGMPPVLAHPGGPYTVPVMTALTLDASASTGHQLAHAWDLDGDGLYNDAIGPSPTLSPAHFAALGLGAGTHPIRLLVTDAVGVQHTADTTLTVLDDASLAPSAWTFPLEVAFGSEVDLIIGVAPGASQGRDTFDADAFGHTWDGAFTALHTPGGGPALQRAINGNDIDDNGEPDYADWLLQVTAGAGNPCYLWWDSDNPTAATLWLVEIDGTAGVPEVDACIPPDHLPMRMDDVDFLLVPSGETRYYRIVHGALRQTLSFRVGWNLFSLSHAPFDPADTGILAAAGIQETPWTWDAAAQGYVANPAGVFTGLSGHWLYVEADAQVDVDGIRIGERSQPLEPGWNLVGVGAVRVLVENPDVFLPGYRYEPATGLYVKVHAGDLLEPGVAYWFFANLRTFLNP